MKGNRFLVQADHRFRGVIGFLVRPEYVLHLFDVFVIEFRDGRQSPAGFEPISRRL